MDFISNLIKRPISLVLSETSTTMDKYPISASLPNTPSGFEKKTELNTSSNENEETAHNKRLVALSSSYHDDNMTDFIGVPEEFLDEFKDILPPPPLCMQRSDPSTQSLLDLEITRSLSITPPPPPLTPSMKASQTIDELLSQINDNLQQAGLNDEVLALASPPANKSELSPLSSKTALNNSKLSTSASNTQLNTSKNSTKAAGPANLNVFENSSSLHKFPLDSELENCREFNDQMNNTGVNKSNKFVGLTEFDETKIPELPGDLNPNIEEQYNVTFEKCFVPTFQPNKDSADPEEQCKVDNTHLLLPTEADNASDTETFADCNDEKDPLASTFAETGSLNVTTDVESYQSAFMNSYSSNFNNTMDNIADITLEAESEQAIRNNPIQVTDEDLAQQKEHQVQTMHEDEPMDVDMSITMEMLHNTSNDIQNVEKVLQHAENILQHLEDKKPLKELNNEQNLLKREMDNTAKQSDQKEKDQAKQEVTLNKSLELHLNKTKTEVDNLSKSSKENIEPDSTPNLSKDIMNLSSISNSSGKAAVINQSGNNLNLTLNLNTSISSQKNSAPCSPSFPMKTTPNTGFPRSPKAVVEKHTKSPFLEKSDFLANAVNQTVEEIQTINQLPNAIACNILEPNTGNEAIKRRTFAVAECTEEPNVNTFLEPSTTVGESVKRRVFAVENSTEEPNENNTLLPPSSSVEETTKRRTFSIVNSTEEPNDNSGEQRHNEKELTEKRRTFNVNTDENVVSNTLMRFPSLEKAENKRLTFNANEHINTDENATRENALSEAKNDINPRRTFVFPIDETKPGITEEPAKLNSSTEHDSNLVPSTQQATLNTSSEAMEVDDIPENISQNTTLPISEVEQQSFGTPPSANIKKQEASISVVQEHTQSLSSSLEEHNKEPSLNEPSTSHSPTPQDNKLSPPITARQSISKSPSPTSAINQNKSSPPLPTGADSKREANTSLSSDHENINENKMSHPIDFEPTTSKFASKPLPAVIQKRPPIRDARSRAADILSAKEQSNIKVKDEKDILVEKLTPSPPEEVFTAVSATSTTLTNSSEFSGFDQTSSSCSSVDHSGEQEIKIEPIDEEFSGNNNIILNPSDFDYLLTKGNNNAPVDRSSLLLKFDPLLGVPVPVNQGQPQLQQFQIATNTNPALSPTLEEDEHNDSKRSFVTETKPGASAKFVRERSQEVKQQLQAEQQNRRQLLQGANKKNATMSVDVIKDMSLDNDCNKTFENSNSTQSDDKQINYKMDELEKKIKNEVLKTEDIEKKLKDAEQREEALIKRITEKDKTIAKMTGVIEAYEKAIAELIADKEQLTQNYEKQLAEVKADRDSNYHHLTSLETTFSDLHVKYEKSKEMTCQLKESEEALLAEKRKNLENLHLQEQRYDKMKNHAMQQLEIANKKLESLTREHSIEITKLKALLKKEEIARSSINEQLAHKTKENAELVKICDELISGQGSNFSFEPFDPKKH